MSEIKYELTEAQKLYFSCVLILSIINEENVIFPQKLQNDEIKLEPFLRHMTEKGWLEITSEGYVMTTKGRKMLLNHKEKLVEFRAIYKIYSAVDLEQGEFAYDKYFDFETDEEFIDYMNESQFEDMRVAVCEFKKINPLEVIFLEMVDNGSFELGGSDWVHELINSKTWDLIVDIANSNIHVGQLEETDSHGTITSTGEDVMEIILRKGTELASNLLKKQQESDNKISEDENEVESETTTTTTTETVFEDDYYVEDPYYDYGYYTPYYDPFYVSVCWALCWY